MGKLDGKTAIVTGASRGIGEAIARVYAREGASVIMTDILEEEGNKVATDIGEKAHFMTHDVTDETRWAEVVKQATNLFGGVDILVNNAGIIIFKALQDLNQDDIRRVLDINLLGTILGTQAVTGAMKTIGAGSIINMSSADGLSAANGLAAYVASKWGVRGFTKAAALELGPHKIRVNSIHPGGVYTPMANPHNTPRDLYDQSFNIYPAQRACDPEEIAQGALYLASNDSRYCMGSELAIDGGMTAGHYYIGIPGAPDSG